ncbi:hypothetical protein SPV2_gp23 [Sulfolobus polyhedral virus 2]|uniref:Uncharacterized protein n=1 Tax=Sulfolobus polyhedral virus 2 TaxID=2493125 RepID=A0A3S8NFL8_9VIRU|nr:hypothetical protein KM458_gp23 [Sulfolobus polyhedral virus 2]AZI76022.1 hypothetical protein SPV2_gp23 [Sulfolobus polyhedral virus 2]
MTADNVMLTELEELLKLYQNCKPDWVVLVDAYGNYYYVAYHW